MATQTKQLAASQLELDDIIAKVAEANAAQAAWATAVELAGKAQGPEEGAGGVVKQGAGSGQGAGHQDGEVPHEDDMDLEEAQMDAEAFSKLEAALGPESSKKLLEGFTLVHAKRRKKDLSSCSPSEAMEAGAAAAALVEAVAKAAKEASGKEAAKAKGP